MVVASELAAADRSLHASVLKYPSARESLEIPPRKKLEVELASRSGDAQQGPVILQEFCF